jgi:glutathione S-transferase
MTIQLYGTITSPFVRRVRVVCIEKGVGFSLVDTSAAGGADALKAVSPIGKVPVARFDDGRVVYDSRVIVDEVCHDGWGPLRPPAHDIKGRVDDENAVNLIDEALLSLIRVFYVERAGGDVGAPLLVKESSRARNIMVQLNEMVVRDHLTVGGANDGRLGRPELAVVTAVGWMIFRKTFDLSTTPRLQALHARWAARPSFQQTAPDVA